MRNGLWHCEISHCEIFALRIWNCEIFALRNWNWQCKFKIGIAKWHLALRNFALRNFRIAKLKLALRNGIWHCEISHCEIFALRIWVGFGIAKFPRLLRSAQCLAATVPLLLHPAASHPVSTASHFLHFALVFPLIYGLFDG